MLRYATLILISLIFISSPVFAATWWVRDGGGSVYGTSAGTNVCNGSVNAPYSAGVTPNCAVSNPMLILGAGCGNFGFGPCNVASRIASGDTVNINGDSDISPGTQAQYPIGYDASGVLTPTNSSNCSAPGSLNCTMGNPPSGTDSGHLTTIQTTPGSTHRAQLWGKEKVNQVLEADSSYLLLNNLEITDHSNCIYGGPALGCTNSSPFGSYGINGVFYGGTGSEMENMWIHGMSHDGTQSDNLTNWVSENNIINGNAFNGDAPGDLYGASGTATYSNVTWDKDIIVFNGCGEVYPPHSSNPYDTANYEDCFDQANSGQGDGLGLQSAFSNCGVMTFTNDDVSFNTQDGIDMHHCPATGTSYIYRVRAEGNEGQQIKMANANSYMENDLFVGDCFWHHAGNPIDFNNGNMNNCRAGGSTITIAPYGGNYNIDNTTVLGTGPELIDNSPDPNTACSSPSGTLHMYNDNFIAGWNTPVYGNTQPASWTYQDCTFGGSKPTITEDYNHVWNTNISGSSITCGTSPGTHDKCADSSSGTTASLTSSVIGPTAYYSGVDFGHLLYPAGAGQLIANANNAITLQGTANDFNNFSRGSSWTIGGYQTGSTVVTGGTCFENSECSSGTCTNNVCASGSCTTNGCSCATGSDCSSGICCSSVCASSCGGGSTLYTDYISGKSLISGNSNF